MNLVQEIGQKQTLSFRQAQSLKILSMNNCELYEFLQQEQMENPVLELEGGSLREEFGPPDDRSRGERPGAGGWEGEYEEAGPAADSLQDSLKAQIRFRTYSRREVALIRYIIDLLDEDGYLTVSEGEIAALTKSGPEEVRRCVQAVRDMEPAGVGARSLCECLLLQLEDRGIFDRNLEQIILCCLPDVASGHYRKIAKRLSLSAEAVREYVGILHTLNPRPGSGFGSREGRDYVIPDVILDRQGDSWEIALNDRWMGAVGISRTYSALCGRSEDADTEEYLRDKMRRARFLVRSIEQRRNTLLKVSSAVLEAQRDFFEGRGPLVPMNLGTVADRLGIHESTVSRAIREKYVQSPLGTHPLREYFSVGVSAGCGEALRSSSAVKDMIAGMIRGEDPRSPLSDGALAAGLKARGVEISRRTVAKYRGELRIANAVGRKAG